MGLCASVASRKQTQGTKHEGLPAERLSGATNRSQFSRSSVSFSPPPKCAFGTQEDAESPLFSRTSDKSDFKRLPLLETTFCAPKSKLCCAIAVVEPISIEKLPLSKCETVDADVPEEYGSAPLPVWQRRILMGARCEMPRFSGLILYDEHGRPLPGCTETRTNYKDKQAAIVTTLKDLL